VLRSGLRVEMVGWQLCRGPAALNESEIEAVLRLDTPLARFAVECNSAAMRAYRIQTNEIGISLPDPIAMAMALDPSVCTVGSSHYVAIETSSLVTRGMTVVDRLNVAGDERNRSVWESVLERGRKVSVCWQMDIPRWKEMLYRSLRP